MDVREGGLDLKCEIIWSCLAVENVFYFFVFYFVKEKCFIFLYKKVKIILKIFVSENNFSKLENNKICLNCNKSIYF